MRTNPQSNTSWVLIYSVLRFYETLPFAGARARDCGCVLGLHVSTKYICVYMYTLHQEFLSKIFYLIVQNKVSFEPWLTIEKVCTYMLTDSDTIPIYLNVVTKLTQEITDNLIARNIDNSMAPVGVVDVRLESRAV